MKKNMHSNSLEAYRTGRKELTKRAILILSFLRDTGEILTDRMVMSRLGFSEPNAVRPRITELIELGYLKEAGKVRCKVTGKTVRYVYAVKKQSQGELF